MSFYTDCLPYFTPDMMMKNGASDETIDGNGILYMGEFYDILIEFPDAPLIVDCNAWLHTLYAKAKVAPGVINRGRDNTSRESFDDYIGLCRAAQLFAPEIAEEIYQHGKDHFWYFDNLGGAFSFSAWFGRMPGVAQHMKLCAPSAPGLNWFDRFWWSLRLISTYFYASSETSGRCLSRLMARAYLAQANRYWLCDLAVSIFQSGVRANYPNWFGDIYSRFFRPSHPFAIWMQGRI